MAIVFSCIVFLVAAVLLSLLGMRLYVRPREAMERVAGTVQEHHDVVPAHPSIAFRDLMKKLGTLVPVSPKDVTVMQRRLIRAGYRQENALKVLYGFKLVCGVLFPVAAFALATNVQAEPGNKMIAVLIGAVAGFFGPNEFVRMMAKRRQKQIHRGLANALDLMVVCVESGLGLDQAILQVAKELEKAHPEITEEFAIVNFELKAGKRRAESLRNLADRTAVEDLKKLVAVLIQADRFGTGIAQSLRAHSDYMRVQARQVRQVEPAMECRHGGRLSQRGAGEGVKVQV